ncbi:MAG: CDP-archaeol synthase [Bacteroidetes bacterium]|nr:CDP-archaeol synthase [Cryomorphaceae bacterium]MBL6677202.1 CDP-archaeol synthase [Flavobacteriaceae bacterium]MDA0330537.1 CDP-archaeol synthase [Bacteroidota bacterium]MDA0885009.1 CDP-archaeol synthase [Bacteroidota bacterium]MDA1225446.1 CDP-archaeol synthase [Bacteroidota bacterium]
MINFLPRLISGILYIVIVFTSIVISMETFIAVFSIFTIISTYEAYTLYQKIKSKGYRYNHPIIPPIYVLASMIALIYIPFSGDNIYNPFIILLIFILIWISDTMSYFFGSLFGRTNLKIEASPNKTWEGFIGGLFCSVLFSYVSFNFIQEIFPFWKTIVLGFIIPIFGLFGDIVQSKIKRKAGVKDSGNLIPGHGGLFDRLDSAIGNSFIVLIISIL